MVFEERQPTLRLLAIDSSLQTPQIAGDCRFRNIETELQQFAMDASRAPVRIIGLDPPNQLKDFLADFVSVHTAGTETTGQSEASAMPGNDGFRSLK